LDMFIVNSQTQPILYRNDLESANDWIRFETRGRTSNRYGLGARLWLRSTEASAPQLIEMIGGSNYLAQNEMVAHFGLGELTGDRVHSVLVEWPSGWRWIVQFA